MNSNITINNVKRLTSIVVKASVQVIEVSRNLSVLQSN